MKSLEVISFATVVVSLVLLVLLRFAIWVAPLAIAVAALVWLLS